MSIVDENLEILLKGGSLVKEIFPQRDGLRSWLEISINSDNIGPYPLRLPPNGFCNVTSAMYVSLRPIVA